MNKNPFAVGTESRETFLGSKKIQESVEVAGVFLGRNIAMIRKFKLDEEYDNKKGALKLGKPIYGFYIVPLSVTGLNLTGDPSAPIITAQVKYTNPETSETEDSVIEFTPSDYFQFRKGMSDAEIVSILNGGVHILPIEQRIFRSPYEATMACNALNRSSYGILNAAISDLANQREMMSTAMKSMNAPYQNP